MTRHPVRAVWLVSGIVLCSCGEGVLGPEDGPSTTRIRAGFDFTCAIDIDASIVCWGQNAAGQLGIGDDTSQVTPVQIISDERFISVSTKANAHHACAVTWRGRVYCWGENDFGQLGNGSQSGSLIPTLVDSDLSFRVVAAGWRFTCALTYDNEAYCWGRGEWGQLGDGLGQRSTRPVAVGGGHKFRAIEVGSNNLVCGLTERDRVLCWGLEFFGSLGADAPEVCTRSDGLQLACARLPQPIASDLSFMQLTVGNSFACAVDTEGFGWCWGLNTAGQIGSETAAECESFDGLSLLPCSPVALRVSGEHRFASLTAGAAHTCGVTTAGAGLCWGSNGTGQGGDGSLGTATAVPTPIAGGLEFLNLTAGANHTCAETLGRNLWCWGLNDAGQLGTGNNNFELIPALVVQRR